MGRSLKQLHNSSRHCANPRGRQTIAAYQAQTWEYSSIQYGQRAKGHELCLWHLNTLRNNMDEGPWWCSIENINAVFCKERWLKFESFSLATRIKDNDQNPNWFYRGGMAPSGCPELHNARDPGSTSTTGGNSFSFEVLDVPFMETRCVCSLSCSAFCAWRFGF